MLLQVNHSLTFKDPDTGACTNKIEASWRAAKSVTTSAGRKSTHVAGNLAKYMFFKRCQLLEVDRMDEFLRLAGILYDPRRADTDNAVEADDTVSDEDVDAPFD